MEGLERRWHAGGAHQVLGPSVGTRDIVGRPSWGSSISGYDYVKKKHVGMWVDGVGTALLTMEGHFDPAGEMLAVYGTSSHPAIGEHDKLMGQPPASSTTTTTGSRSATTRGGPRA